MATILVTTDLSEDSARAFPVAKKYAQALDAELIVLAVIEDPAQAAMVYAMDFPIIPDREVQDQFRDRVRADLKALIEKHFQAVNVRGEVVEALQPVHIEVVDQAKRLNADLIVIATHGRSGLSRLLIGSVTERIIRHAECPTLIVPVLPER